MRARQEQLACGLPKPQVNEEFGYEDHYAVWVEGRQNPTREWASRLRLAWEMRMAGALCTLVESAKDGASGWINGLRLTDSDLRDGHRNMRAFFETMNWSSKEPYQVSGHAYALRSSSEEYADYGDGKGWTALPLSCPRP
jgi:hypothetical protein